MAIEEEVNVPQNWLIVILLERKGAAEPCYTNAHLRNVHWKGIFKFFRRQVSSHFRIWKARLAMVKNEWLYASDPGRLAGLDLAECITQIAVA